MVRSLRGCKLDQKKKLQWSEVLKEESTIFTERENLLAHRDRLCLIDTEPLTELYIVFMFVNNKLKRPEPAQDIKRVVYTSLKHITAKKNKLTRKRN